MLRWGSARRQSRAPSFASLSQRRIQSLQCFARGRTGIRKSSASAGDSVEQRFWSASTKTSRRFAFASTPSSGDASPGAQSDSVRGSA